MTELQKQINLNNVPKHVAIIMDGNGRWAKGQGEERLFGHNSGVHSVREALRAATKLGVEYLTLYTFSTENWNRPQDEVEGLMNLFVDTLAKEIEELHESGVKIKAIGNINDLPKHCILALNHAEDYTKENNKITLNLALSYSSRWEILEAVKKIAVSVKHGEVSEDDISNELFEKYLETHDLPDPELVIRTSGEQRISNFLLWQIAYSEFYFTEKLWPDFKEDDFFEAILAYQSRERRFGKTSHQVNDQISQKS